MVKKAIVLAAGFGTRLKPLTCAVPKPLMPVWGEPMLARIVSLLRENGVDDIVVNCHYLHEQIERWCADNGCRVQYEPEILGTGGVLNPLRGWLGDEDFYLVNGDIVLEGVELGKWIGKTAVKRDEVIAEALVTTEGPRTIEVEPEFRFVTNWRSDDAGWEGTYTYCGFARLKNAILDYVKPEGFSSIVEAYEKAMMAGKFVRAVELDGMLWTDAGTMESYIDLNRTEEDDAFVDIPQISAALDGRDEKIEFLGARGSDRAFFKTGDDRIVIVYDDAKRGENARYASHAQWLRDKGMPVPEVRSDLPAMKTLAMEWAGSEKKMSLEEYVKVVEKLAEFNALGTASDLPELEPEFDASLYRWERELFFEHCLGTRFHWTEPPTAVKTELENVAALLLKEPKALVHRDFQSTNVLWKGGNFAFIDFQGMRLGPGAYDLASLVYDPYVEFTEGERRALIALYAKKSGREEISKVLPYAAVERLVQCLGAYGRLASVGQPQFGKFVLPALRNLLDAADRAGLDATGALAEDLIAAELKTHEHHHHHHHGEGCSCGEHHH